MNRVKKIVTALAVTIAMIAGSMAAFAPTADALKTTSCVTHRFSDGSLGLTIRTTCYTVDWDAMTSTKSVTHRSYSIGNWPERPRFHANQ